MACRITRNNTTGEIESVYASNGEKSIAYQSFLDVVENTTPEEFEKLQLVYKPWIEAGIIKNTSAKEIALGMYNRIHGENFKNWFKDSKHVDSNGEPLITDGYFIGPDNFKKFVINSPAKVLADRKPSAFNYSGFTKEVGLTKKQIHAGDTAKIQRKITAYNKRNGTAYYAKWQPVGQSTLYTWILIDNLSKASYQDNTVNYALKSVNILNSLKADEIFRKGDKNNWSLDKMLTELSVPKDQQELIKSFNTRNRDEIITSLLANYSYTIEINTAKEYEKNINDSLSDYHRDQFSEEELREMGMGPKEDLLTNTQYYSNLTVPGGTNYTENEIATPAITPSIKGHAQFSTDKGIGWFRSDDKHPFTGFLEDLIASGTIKKVPCG